MDLLSAIILLAVLVAIYFAPAWVAERRRHKDVNAIFLVNLLFGWTLLGWGVAMIWAAPDLGKPSDAEEEKRCPYCAETIKAEAVVCRYCGRGLLESKGSGKPDKRAS